MFFKTSVQNNIMMMILVSELAQLATIPVIYDKHVVIMKMLPKE